MTRNATVYLNENVKLVALFCYVVGLTKCLECVYSSVLFCLPFKDEMYFFLDSLEQCLCLHNVTRASMWDLRQFIGGCFVSIFQEENFNAD